MNITRGSLIAGFCLAALVAIATAKIIVIRGADCTAPTQMRVLVLEIPENGADADRATRVRVYRGAPSQGWARAHLRDRFRGASEPGEIGAFRRRVGGCGRED